MAERRKSKKRRRRTLSKTLLQHPVHPLWIYSNLNAIKPVKKVIITEHMGKTLVDKRAADSLDEILDLLNDLVKIPGGVWKLFTVKGRRIRNPRSLLKLDMIVVAGKEKFNVQHRERTMLEEVQLREQRKAEMQAEIKALQDVHPQSLLATVAETTEVEEDEDSKDKNEPVCVSPKQPSPSSKQAIVTTQKAHSKKQASDSGCSPIRTDHDRRKSSIPSLPSLVKADGKNSKTFDHKGEHEHITFPSTRQATMSAPLLPERRRRVDAKNGLISPSSETEDEFPEYEPISTPASRRSLPEIMPYGQPPGEHRCAYCRDAVERKEREIFRLSSQITGLMATIQEFQNKEQEQNQRADASE
eukprot:m.139130 g.139130  ORF g.139130 m.139130 type:complete len:358 (+) comp24063_c0_seq2:2-1075(+)